MINKIKVILMIGLFYSANSVFAGDGLANIVCTKGESTFTAFADSRDINSPSMWGLQLSHGSKIDISGDGYRLLEAMLKSSPVCEDTSSRVVSKPGNIFICAGELFATKGIYGQILTTSNSVKVFKTTIAAGNGWVCN